jgi:pilus assembly protein CpaE
MNIGRLRCVTISANKPLSIRLANALSELPGVELVKQLSEYPDESALRRVLLFDAPEIIILDAANGERGVELASLLDRIESGAQVVAICGKVGTLAALMRAGVREYVRNGFNNRSLGEAIGRASEVLRRQPAATKKTGQVVSFLPVKPGVGASTIIVNTSRALSRIEGVRAFLGDFDTGAGIIGFMFKLNHGYTLKDALHHAHEMDDTLWTRMAARVDDLDILPADCEAEHRLDFEKIGRYIEHLRRVYTVSCLDLSGHMDPVSMEVLRESSKIYLVCSQELTCLHMLRRKAALLNRMGLEDKVRVLVNRYDKNNAMNLAQIAEVANCKVVTTLPNDYRQSTVGADIGTKVDPKGMLWRSFERVAHDILHMDEPQRPAKRRFAEYFSLPGFRGASPQAAT